MIVDKIYYFNCEKWFDLGRGDGKIERVIHPVKLKPNFTQVTTTTVCLILSAIACFLTVWCLQANKESSSVFKEHVRLFTDMV